MKKNIRLTENDLHKIVRNSVKRILQEDLRASEQEDINAFASIIEGCDHQTAIAVATELNDFMLKADCGYLSDMIRKFKPDYKPIKPYFSDDRY